MIHPRAEKIQAPKLDMGAQGEADAVVSHPKRIMTHRGPYLVRQLSVSRTVP
jgi:hypothetical protein